MNEVLGAQGGLEGGLTCSLIILMMRGECLSRGPFACSISMAWVVVLCQETGRFSEDGSVPGITGRGHCRRGAPSPWAFTELEPAGF